jgi:hypothetical protein
MGRPDTPPFACDFNLFRKSSFDDVTNATTSHCSLTLPLAIVEFDRCLGRERKKKELGRERNCRPRVALC